MSLGPESGGSGGPTPTVSGVLRAALALLRRRWLLFVILAVVLAVLPDVVADAAVDLDDPAVPAALGGQDGEVANMLTSTIETLEDFGPGLLSILLNVVVLPVALRDAVARPGPAPSLARAVRRLLPVAVVAALLDAGWIALNPGRVLYLGESLISCWILFAPAWAVERPRLAAFPRRLAALTRDHRRPLAALVALYVVADALVATLDARLTDVFETETAAGRAAEVVGASAQAAVSVFAALAAASLYAALRRAEGPSPATLADFD